MQQGRYRLMASVVNKLPVATLEQLGENMESMPLSFSTRVQNLPSSSAIRCCSAVAVNLLFTDPMGMLALICNKCCPWAATGKTYCQNCFHLTQTTQGSPDKYPQLTRGTSEERQKRAQSTWLWFSQMCSTILFGSTTKADLNRHKAPPTCLEYRKYKTFSVCDKI